MKSRGFLFRVISVLGVLSIIIGLVVSGDSFAFGKLVNDKPEIFAVAGGDEGSTYLQPGDKVQGYLMLRIQDWNESDENVAKAKNINFQLINSHAENGVSVKQDSIKLKKLSNVTSADITEFASYTKLLTEGKDSQKPVDDTSNLENPKVEGDKITGTIKSMEKNTLYYVTFDIEVPSNNGVNGQSFYFVCTATGSNRALLIFYAGRPVWDTEVKATKTNTPETDAGTVQPGDTFDVTLKSTMTKSYVEARDAEVSLTLPEGIELADEHDTLTATFTAKGAGEAGVDKTLTDSSGQKEVGPDGKGTVIKWDADVTEDEAFAKMPKDSTVTATVKVKASEDATSETKNIAAQVRSKNSDQDTGKDTGDVRVQSPQVSVTATPDRTRAQVGDTVTWTVNID